MSKKELVKLVLIYDKVEFKAKKKSKQRKMFILQMCKLLMNLYLKNSKK